MKSLHLLSSPLFWSLCCVVRLSAISLNEWLPSSLVTRESQELSYEYAVNPTATIDIQLIRGNIRLETWSNAKVKITATKKARSPEELAAADLHIEQTKTKVSVQAQQPHTHTTIDPVIIVPAGSRVSLKIAEQGLVQVISAPRHLTIYTNKDDISITTLTDGTITAHTDKGSIAAVCEAFSHTSSLLLTAPQGSITLQLPPLIHARLEARCQKGIVTSTLPITFDPFTTKLDKLAWKKLQKTVIGSIGDGEAPITLSARGNITLTTLEN